MIFFLLFKLYHIINYYLNIYKIYIKISNIKFIQYIYLILFNFKNNYPYLFIQSQLLLFSLIFLTLITIEIEYGKLSM